MTITEKKTGLSGRTLEQAERLGILPLMQELDEKLLAIPDTSSTCYDLDDYDDIGYIILVPGYNIRASREDYFDARVKNRQAIISVCASLGLVRTEDTLEDYGAHWYIVMRDTLKGKR